MIEGIKEGLFTLIRLFGAYIVFAVARNVSIRSKCQKFQAYLYALVISAFLAFMSWGSYGTHVEDADPLYGSGGTTVVDFEPTDEERRQHAFKMFTICSVLTLIGTHAGLGAKDNQDLINRLNT